MWGGTFRDALAPTTLDEAEWQRAGTPCWTPSPSSLRRGSARFRADVEKSYDILPSNLFATFTDSLQHSDIHVRGHSASVRAKLLHLRPQYSCGPAPDLGGGRRFQSRRPHGRGYGQSAGTGRLASAGQR